MHWVNNMKSNRQFKFITADGVCQHAPGMVRDGLYLVRVIRVHVAPDAIKILYDFAFGENAGWASRVFFEANKWPFYQRIDLSRGQQVLAAFMRAVSENPSGRVITEPKQAEGCFVCLDLTWESYEGKMFPRVKRVYAASAYPLTSDDYMIGTDCWAKGSKTVNQAIARAFYSQYPVLLADTQEKQSPMVEFCAANQICLVPVSGMPGDYMCPDGTVVVDRKNDITELYHNFSCSSQWSSYAVAAQLAAAERKWLVFVVAVDPEDRVRNLADLNNWTGLLPNGTELSGATLFLQIQKFRFLFNHVCFLFVPRDNLCNKIWESVCSRQQISKPLRIVN